jgi:hypothetical protein
LQNISGQNEEGIRKARKIVDLYIKSGNGRPAEILAEVAGEA